MRKPTPQQAGDFYRILRDYLGGISGGDAVIEQFERDPEASASELANFLRRHAPDDQELASRLAQALSTSTQPQFVTEVTGGHVEQIVNIAKVGALQLTIKRQFFLLRDLRQLLIVLLSIALVAAGIGFSIWRSVQPRVMDGDFNIAVAEFGEVTPAGLARSATGAQLGDALFSLLEGELAGTRLGLDVQIDHKNMGVVAEQEEAEALAERIDADMVIYGTVRSGKAGAELDPTFWIREQPDTEELTGQNRMGYPIQFAPEQTRYGDAVNYQMRERAAVVLSITEGLVYLKAEAHEAAERAFESARKRFDALGNCSASAPTDAISGCEVVYLLLAIAQSAGHSYDRAEVSLAQSLAINDEYARAYIALGNIYYAQAEEQGLRADYLDQAMANYTKAIAAQDAPASAFALPKAKLSLANVYTIQAQLAQDRFEHDRATELFAEAARLYQEVIAEYDAIATDSVRRRLRDVAATAYFGLGTTYARQYFVDEATDAFEMCIEVTASEDLKRRAQEQIDAIAAVG